jgi:hypothetical protein
MKSYWITLESYKSSCSGKGKLCGLQDYSGDHIIVDNHSVVLRDLSQVVEDGDPEGVEDHP